MWRSPLTIALAAIGVLPSAVYARSATGDRVLVVLQHDFPKARYSSFWSSLEERGYTLTFKGPKEEQSPLVSYGEKQFDHLIVLAPSASFAESLKPVNLVSALTDHNIDTLYVLTSSISEAQRDFAREFDLEFEERESGAVDYYSHTTSSLSSASPSSPAYANILLPPKASVYSQCPTTIISKSTRGSSSPILYSGIAHTVGSNPLLIPVLHGLPTSYSADLSEADPIELALEAGSKKNIVAGEGAGLVTAMQTRGNARVGWIGSEVMLSDGAWSAKVADQAGNEQTTGNAAFVEDFIKWLFQETGVLKVIDTDHHRIDETTPREMYRVKDDLTYSITIAEHTTTSNNTSSWKPFHADDVQMDFTMLDPFIRTNMFESDEAVEIGTKFKLDFTAPDRHGVFKFVVNYWRPGYTFLSESTRASVVAFRHDEYPRFITGAWPFYSAAFNVSATFLLFCSLWVWIGEGKKDVKAIKVAKGKKID